VLLLIAQTSSEPRRVGRQRISGVRTPKPKVVARKAEAKGAARAKPLVETLGPRADVELQASSVLEGLAQEFGAD
jgi:hypothetical protein